MFLALLVGSRKRLELRRAALQFDRVIVALCTAHAPESLRLREVRAVVLFKVGCARALPAAIHVEGHADPLHGVKFSRVVAML